MRRQKAAVDFFAEHSANQNDVCVGFYGGEPLLEYDLIKAMVEYSEKIFKGKKSDIYCDYKWFSFYT